jgi:hypothetical protein
MPGLDRQPGEPFIEKELRDRSHGSGVYRYASERSKRDREGRRGGRKRLDGFPLSRDRTVVRNPTAHDPGLLRVHTDSFGLRHRSLEPENAKVNDLDAIRAER